MWHALQRFSEKKFHRLLGPAGLDLTTFLESDMTKFFARVLGVACALAMLTIAGSATEIPLGYISFDVTGANVAQFDIVNLTGGNGSAPGDPSFPVTTAVSLNNLEPDCALCGRRNACVRLVLLHAGWGWAVL